MQNGWALFCIGLLHWGCSGGDDVDAEISDQSLSGTVGGNAWTFVRADTDAFLSEGEPEYWVDLYASSGAMCQSSGGDSIILLVPRNPGEYELGFARSATFVVEDTSNNLVATTGRIVVDEVTTTTIRGGAYIHFDDANSVNGQFEVNICP
ncbi:MAG TPA: hypothetical protein VIM73_16420 [Polyangiaceae bacterium]